MIKNYTTTVAAGQSVREIQAMLINAGATSFNTVYDPAVKGWISAIEFTFQGATYRMDANAEGVLTAMRRQRIEGRYLTLDQARKVIWRIIKDRIAVEISLIEAGAASFGQVFLGNELLTNGQTFWDKRQAMRMIEASPTNK